MKIAIVDDSLFSRNLTQRMLKKVFKDEELEIYLYKDAISALKEMPELDLDFSVMDIVMPEMTGVELLAKLKSQNFTTPVIMATADIQQSTRQKCQDLGAFAFLEKPLSQEKLADALEALPCRK